MQGNVFYTGLCQMSIKVRGRVSQGILEADKYSIFACIASSKLCLAIEKHWNTGFVLKNGSHRER